MGYRFMGFFAPGDVAMLETAKAQWPSARGRRITVPFTGIGAAAPEMRHAESYEDYEKAVEVAYAIEEQLPEWSRQYPEIKCVFIDADCFGGTCIYTGYVCQNGSVIEHVTELKRAEKTDGLERLVRHLGVELPANRFFEPFICGYFENQRG